MIAECFLICVPMQPGEGVSRILDRWGSATLGLTERAKNFSEFLKIGPKNLSVYSKYEPKILILFKGLNMETVFLRSKKPLRAINGNYFNENYINLFRSAGQVVSYVVKKRP